MRYILLLGFVLVSACSSTPKPSAQPLVSITNPQQLDEFLTSYHDHPRPDLVDDAMAYIDSSGLAAEKSKKFPLLMAFSCLFVSADAERKTAWKTSIADFKKPARKVFSLAMIKTPETLIKQVPLSPAANDMNWAAYFITGNTEYIDHIVDTLQYYDEREDMQLYLTSASAKWSLASNSRQHSDVQQHLTRVQEQVSGDVSEQIDDLLEKNPEAISKTIELTLKEQHDAGVW